MEGEREWNLLERIPVFIVFDRGLEDIGHAFVGFSVCWLLFVFLSRSISIRDFFRSSNISIANVG